MNKALIDSIRKDLDALHMNDGVKSVYVPFETLGADMVYRLPSIQGEILVVSDAGLLVSILQRLHRERLPFGKVQFLCHTEALQKFGSQLGIRTILVCYNQLNTWIKKADMGLKFDVIIGNPPYQSDSADGTRPLWPDFISLGRRLLNTQGFMQMVVPQTWASNSLVPGKGVKNTSLVRSEDFSKGWLVEADFDVGQYFPGVGSTFSTFIFQLAKPQLTKIKTPAGSFTADYSEMPWVPVNGDEVVISILRKVCWNNLSKLKWINNGREQAGFRPGTKNVSRVKSGEFKYPLANTSAQYSKGEFAYSCVEHPSQRVKKVIVSGSGYPRPFYDDGVLGLSLHSRGVSADDHNPEAVISILNSKLIKFCSSTKPASGSGSYTAVIADSIPAINEPMSDEQIYAYFGLDQDEIDLIERTVK
jgi:Eco57I restriction-modification methylase